MKECTVIVTMLVLQCTDKIHQEFNFKIIIIIVDIIGVLHILTWTTMEYTHVSYQTAKGTHWKQVLASMNLLQVCSNNFMI